MHTWPLFVTLLIMNRLKYLLIRYKVQPDPENLLKFSTTNLLP